MAITLPTSIAPAFISSVFAFSIEHEYILNRNLVYVIQVAIAFTGAVMTFFLKEPTHDWREDSDE